MLEPDPNMSEYDLAVAESKRRHFDNAGERRAFIIGYEAALLDVRAWAAKKLGEVPGG